MVRLWLKLCLFLYLYSHVQLLAKMNARLLNKKPHHSKSTKLHINNDYLLKTPGCTIPNMWKTYHITEANECNSSCGIRAVRLAKKATGNIIKYIIDEKLMKKLFGQSSYECCSQFAYRRPNDKLEFTKCKPFKNGTKRKLRREVVTVNCRPKGNTTHNEVYEDAYIVPKKLKAKAKKLDKNSWNVLILGMDSMSRARAIQSMPRLVNYFKRNNWLDYRAFQTVSFSTFSNVINLLTGTKASKYDEVCDGNVSQCNDLMIWSKYKKSGYVTAHGEDHLPEIYKIKNQLRALPTDHYTRPLFLLGERGEGNIVCVKKNSAALHILSYADQFVKVYKNEKIFGFFWMMSYSRNPNHRPILLQNHLTQFFEKLNSSGAMNSTIIFFLSDHGIRFGKLKIPVASHYDDKLPMLFMWYPQSFRKRFKKAYENLQLNQHRLTTHYDVHSTLWNILKFSNKNVKIIPPEACPRCSSLFKEKSVNRSCEDINVSEKWCSCHVLNAVNSTDIAATLVPDLLLFKLAQKETYLKIKSILRHHWYKNNYDKSNVTYYVIAIHAIPGDVQYEATIKRQLSEYRILEDIDTISPTEKFYDTSLCKPAGPK